jgi:hypothetical protein
MNSVEKRTPSDRSSALILAGEWRSGFSGLVVPQKYFDSMLSSKATPGELTQLPASVARDRIKLTEFGDRRGPRVSVLGGCMQDAGGGHAMVATRLEVGDGLNCGLVVADLLPMPDRARLSGVPLLAP